MEGGLSDSDGSQVLLVIVLGRGHGTTLAGSLLHALGHRTAKLGQGTGVHAWQVDGAGLVGRPGNLVDGEALASRSRRRRDGGGQTQNEGSGFAEDDHFDHENVKQESSEKR